MKVFYSDEMVAVISKDDARELDFEARRPKPTKIINMETTIEQPEGGASLPPRTGSESWRVFQVNDCDWWLARSLDEAKQSAAEYYGCRTDDEDMISEAAEITEGELDRLKYYPDGNRKGYHHSFREELAARIAAGPKVEMFATTEF